MEDRNNEGGGVACLHTPGGSVRWSKCKGGDKAGGYRALRTVSHELQGNRNEMARDTIDRCGERAG